MDWKHLHEVDGLFVDLSWDSSDLFYFENWQGVIIVNEKVKEIIEKNKLKNIEFKKLSEFKFEWKKITFNLYYSISDAKGNRTKTTASANPKRACKSYYFILV